MQSEPQAVVVLRGIAVDGRPDWIFAPAHWDVLALERRFPFSGRPQSPRRRVLIRPSELEDLVARYGEVPCVDVPSELTLSQLMARNMLAIEMMIARAPSGGLGHAAVP